MDILKEIEEHLKQGHHAEVTICSGSPVYMIHLTSLMQSKRIEVAVNKVSIDDLLRVVRGI